VLILQDIGVDCRMRHIDVLKRIEAHAKDLGLVENGAHDGNINVAQREMREDLLPVESKFEVNK